MYWLQRINQWSLVCNDDGWSCYEHDPDSAEHLGHGWGVLRDWQELPIVRYEDGWLGPGLPREVPTEVAEGLLASAKASGHGGPVVKPY